MANVLQFPKSSPAACPVCSGAGYCTECEEPCQSCDGIGQRVLRSPAPRDREPARLYVALSVDGIVDEGTRLTPFLDAVCESFPDLDEDLAIAYLEEGQGARIVAVIKLSVDGPKIIYL